MLKRPQSQKKANKKVGFSLHGQEIPATNFNDTLSAQNQGNKSKLGMKQVNLEFYVAKAKEFESYKQMPKFTKPLMAVIHPSPSKIHKETRHVPPKTLKFDGETIPIKPKRFEPKQIPDHLIRPQIDEEKLMQIRAQQKLLEAQNRSGSKKKISLAAQKHEQLLAKTKSDINIKIKKAEKNIKIFFTEIKKLLDKPDDDLLLPGSNVLVEEAKLAAVQDKFIQKVFQSWAQIQKGQFLNPRAVSKQEFSNFLRFIAKDLTEVPSSDIYMNLNKQLSKILVQFGTPNRQDDTMDQLEFSNQLSGQHQLKNSNNDIDLTNNLQNFKISMYGLAQNQINDMRLDLAIMDAEYKKWAVEDQSLSGVLNNKLTKQKNTDFRMKLDSWKARKLERKALKQRNFEHGKALRDFFSKINENFNLDKDKIEYCVTKFDEFSENKEHLRKQIKIINNYLCGMPEASHHIMQLDDLDKQLKNEQLNNNIKMKFINEFVNTVKQECVMNQNFFSFFDIPELIIKKNYTRKEYDENIIKILLKVKNRYLAEKARELPDKPLDQIQITDDDLIPLELFDGVIAQIKHKIDDRTQSIVEFIQECKQAVVQTIQKLQIDSDKTKKIIEQNVLAAKLNSRMEDSNIQYFKNNFIHRNMYMQFIKQQGNYKSAVHFLELFNEVMKVEQSTNKYHQEYKRKLEIEIQKFSGKISVGEGAETASEMTSATKLTKASGKSLKKAQTAGSKSSSPNKAEDLQDASFLQGQLDGTINDRDNMFDPNPMATQGNRMDEEEALEQEKLMAQEKKNKNADSQFQDLFISDPSGTQFNPSKKFGVIETEGTLIYDNITSSYPLNMPTENYQKYIMDNLPKKEDGNGNWFIRPHHLETLTSHPKSVRDDVLNTRYFSNYNQQFGKKEEVNEAGEAISKIENHLDLLKSQMFSMMAGRGENPEKLEEMKENLYREALNTYEKFISDKTRFNNRELIIQAYEGVLTYERAVEKEILNKQRFTEYEQNRSPQDLWYMMKTSDFQKELYRNRVALKPNNTNAVYLENLQDKNLY